MAITTAVKEIILDLCRQNPEKRWDLHVSAVVKSSLKLGKLLMLTQKQLEIVELAAWLHDIEKIKGEENVWRRRIGNYRIFYEINPKRRSINIFWVERRTSSTY